MTHEKITIDDLSDDENRTLNLLAEQLDAKAPRNRTRTAYYDGRRAIDSIGGVIPPQDHEQLLAAGATAIFGPGTVIADAAADLIKRLTARLT